MQLCARGFPSTLLEFFSFQKHTMANRPARLDENVLVISDLRAEAAKTLSRATNEYFNHGSGDMITARDNELAYDRYKIRPRVLKQVNNIDPSTSLFGQKVSFPFGFSPCAALKLAHRDGEKGVSRAAAENNIPMCLSSWGTEVLEDVKAQGAGNPYIMQVSILKDRSLALKVIERAEGGTRAIFLTVDLPILGNRLNESRNNWTFPPTLTFPNVTREPSEGANTPRDGMDYDRTIDWETIIPWLRARTSMHIWLKGVYTAEDARLAIQHKVDGIVISNHGGRQLDSAPATLDILREVSPIAKGKIGLAIDGGIRRGSDIFKAIALGADFCFAGRVHVWALAYKGKEGVDLATKILYNEFVSTMALTGCQTLADITRDHVTFLNESGLLAKL